MAEILKPTGFFNAKTKAVMGLSAALTERFGGKVPNTLEELVTLPGVGRKTANVVLGNAFGVPGITVDTHFGRLRAGSAGPRAMTRSRSSRRSASSSPSPTGCCSRTG